LLVHGFLLVLQYLLLLNTPYGACVQDGKEDKGWCIIICTHIKLELKSYK